MLSPPRRQSIAADKALLVTVARAIAPAEGRPKAKRIKNVLQGLAHGTLQPYGMPGNSCPQTTPKCHMLEDRQ